MSPYQISPRARALHRGLPLRRDLPLPRGLSALLVLLTMLLAGLLTSTARAGSCQGVACVTAGPRLAQVDSTQGPLLNALLGGLLGSSVQLNVADWNGLNDSNVDLGLFLNALQTRTSTGSTTAALNAQATLAQFLGAAAAAAQQSGDAAAVGAIGALTGGLGVSALNQTARLGDFLKLSFNDGAFGASKLNLLNLVTGGVQLFNSQNTLTTGGTPVSLGALNVDLSALGIAGLSATTPTVTLYAQVTEPPVMVCGPSGTQFYTASIRVKLNVALSGLNNLGVAGVAGASLSLTNLQLYLDIARAQGTLGTVNAVNRSLSLQATPGLVNLYLGSIPDNTFFNRSHMLVPADLGYAKIGTVAASVTVPVTGPTIPVNIDVNAKATGNGSYPLGTLSFAGPYPQSQKVGSSSAAVPVLVDDLIQHLSLQLKVTTTIAPALTAVVNPLLSTLLSTLLTPVTTLSANLIRPVAVAVLRATVDRLLSLLGIGIGQAEVSVLGVNNSCTLNGSVYRDLEPDGVRGGSEVWDGTQVYATLVNGGSPRQAAGVPTSSGAFSFQVGEGTQTVVIAPTGLAGAPASPAGHVFVNPQSGSASTVVTASSAGIPDLPFGLYFGDRISGKTFRDDGRGSGTPNNARQDGSEPVLSGVTLTLSGSGGTRTATTDALGSYALYLPGDWTGNSLSTGAAPVTGVHNGAAATLAGSSGGAGVRPYPLPDPGGAARQADFGLVENLSLSAAPAQSSEAPATLRYTHSLKPGTLGTLALSAVSGDSTGLYLDSNCDGAVDAGERAQTVSSVTVDATWPRDTNGDLKACALELAVSLPAGAAPGRGDSALLSAGLTWSGNPAVQDAAAVTDTSAVVPGTVLVKKVSNLTRAPATEADSVDAFPGDVLRYCLTATNTGPQAATLLVIRDTLKPQVASLAGTLTLNGAVLSDASDTDAGEVVGQGVSVRVPTLASGAQAKVCFQVQVP